MKIQLEMDLELQDLLKKLVDFMMNWFRQDYLIQKEKNIKVSVTSVVEFEGVVILFCPVLYIVTNSMDVFCKQIN